MARTDLTHGQIHELKIAAKALREGRTPRISLELVEQYVLALTGEVLELRNREAHALQMAGYEGGEY